MSEIFEDGGMEEYREYQDKKRLPKREKRGRQIEEAGMFDFEDLFGSHEHTQVD